MSRVGDKWSSSLRTRLIALYRQNPETRLTKDELAVKLYTTPASLDRVIWELKCEGFLERRVDFVLAPVEPLKVNHDR